jgi:hypothetical protein
VSWPRLGESRAHTAPGNYRASISVKYVRCATSTLRIAAGPISSIVHAGASWEKSLQTFRFDLEGAQIGDVSVYQYLIVMLSPGSLNAVVLASERLASEDEDL